MIHAYTYRIHVSVKKLSTKIFSHDVTADYSYYPQVVGLRNLEMFVFNKRNAPYQQS